MKRQRGLSIVAALFLIVVLAAVGAFAVQIGMSQQQTVNLTLLAARAQAAADTGVEWGLTRLTVSTACPSGTLNLNEGALVGFTVKILPAPAPCQTTQLVKGVSTRLYTFTVIATRGKFGTPDFVSRTVTRTASTAPLP